MGKYKVVDDVGTLTREELTQTSANFNGRVLAVYSQSDQPAESLPAAEEHGEIDDTLPVKGELLLLVDGEAPLALKYEPELPEAEAARYNLDELIYLHHDGNQFDAPDESRLTVDQDGAHVESTRPDSIGRGRFLRAIDEGFDEYVEEVF